MQEFIAALSLPDGWWTDPVWIASGIVALVLLVLMLTLSARAGGTTVIKE